MKASKFQRIKIVTMEPLSSANAIRCPDDTYSSEFEIQAFLWSGLKALGVDVRGEVKWRGNDRHTCRFDLVIFNNKKAAGILEIKAAVVTHRVSLEVTRQGSRYRHFGVPVTFIYNMKSAEAFLKDYKPF